MSLNGLDDPTVREAYETASTEPGGWFLLQYTSRDEVNLFNRGNGGIVEIRNAIAQHEETTAPLYGFLRYRRRNVIIKYLPEDCSRLIQARVSVHFNAVCEHFVPNDTTFEITEAKELKDTKLSAACSLHAASGSTSSSTSSLRRRRLMEIAEEEEEEQRATKRQSIVQEEKTPSRPSSLITPEITLDSTLASSPDSTKFSSSQTPPNFVGVERPSSPVGTIEPEPRLSSQSARPDIYSSYSIYGRPKVKLGPRPSMENRPTRTTGNYRPISALPAGFKIFSRKGKSKENSELEETTQANTHDITFNATTIPIPETPPTPRTPELIRPHTSGGGGSTRPSTSSGVSVKSLKMTSSTSLSVKESKMTPEKARLMKAMQLREKKKRMAAMETQQPASTPVEPVKEEAVAEEQAEAETEIPTEEQAAPATETLVLSAEMSNRLSLSQADSGIAIDLASPSTTDFTSEDAQTDSHPTSPIAEASEIGVSTKPSSLSDSTDETVQVCPIPDESRTEHEVPTTESLVHMKNMDIPVAEHADAEIPAESPNQTEEGDIAVSPPDNVLVAEDEATGDAAAKTSTPKDVVVGPAEMEVTEVAEETDASEEQQESNINAPITPVSPCTIALPVSKFATKIPGAGEQNVRGMECNVAELTMLGDESPTSTTTWKIPVSKFSTHDPTAASSFKQNELLAPIVADVAPSDEPAVDPKSSSQETLSPPIELVEAPSSALTSPRTRPFVDPIRTDIEALDKSEGHLSEDDDLMEELQSATLQEATHMTVSKSPITPVFPAPAKAVAESTASSPGINRTASNPTPLRGPLLAPSDVTQSSARSVSSGAAFLHKMAQQPPAQSMASKTGKIGSSISQRIKALEKLSSNNTSAESLHPPARNNVPSSAFFSVRKNSVREPSKSPSVMDRTTMLAPSPGASRDHSPETHRGSPPRDRAASVASRLSVFEVAGAKSPQPQLPSAPPSRGRTESIQVTARIVRDPGHPYPKIPELRKDPADFPPIELRQSPLVVDVHKAHPEAAQEPSVPAPPEVLPTPIVPKETIQERRQSRDKRRSMSTERGEDPPLARRSSLSIVRDFIKDRRNSTAKSPNPDALAAPSSNSGSRSPSRPPSAHKNTFSPRRLSISSRRSSLSRENSAEVISPSAITEAGGGSGDEKDKKSKNRASRFIRRLSASLSGNRKNLTPNISPTVREEDASEVAATESSESRSSSTQQAIIAFMGEVNVQFPDNLLWKRRSMCLDAQGFLIISTIQGPTAEKHLGAGVKRYHLSDFRTPYIPDVEVQELPNSVVLDFVDGSGLQVACEDRAGQLNVLHILQDSHQTHTSFGQ